MPRQQRCAGRRRRIAGEQAIEIAWAIRAFGRDVGEVRGRGAAESGARYVRRLEPVIQAGMRADSDTARLFGAETDRLKVTVMQRVGRMAARAAGLIDQEAALYGGEVVTAEQALRLEMQGAERVLGLS